MIRNIHQDINYERKKLQKTFGSTNSDMFSFFTMFDGIKLFLFVSGFRFTDETCTYEYFDNSVGSHGRWSSRDEGPVYGKNRRCVAQL